MLFSETAVVELAGKRSRGSLSESGNPGLSTRKVDLFCDRPPHPGVVLNNLAGTIKQLKTDTQGEVALTQGLAKYFEQTERTLMVQYALFRVCELGVNHNLGKEDIDKLTQEVIQVVGVLMNGEATIEGARSPSRIAREQTLQEEARTKRAGFEMLLQMSKDNELKKLITRDTMQSLGL